jgi:hypothetical protein
MFFEHVQYAGGCTRDRDGLLCGQHPRQCAVRRRNRRHPVKRDDQCATGEPGRE